MPSEPSVPTVLVVDDERDLLWAFKTEYRHEQFQVMTAATGEEALQYVRNTPCQIVILDAKLPGIDGIRTSELINQHSPETCIILFSGYYDEGDPVILKGLEDGMFHKFVAKPFDMHSLRTMILENL